MAQERSTADHATRVVAAATRTRYDSVSIALHWITVALVLIQFGTSQLWGLFGRPAHHLMVVAHMSFGILLSLAILVRIIWRVIPGHEVQPASKGLDERLAKTVQFLLYALLLAQAVLGYVVRWAGGEQMSFFGILLPSPMNAMTRPQHHMLEEWHEKIGWGIIIIAAGHAAAAFYHHFKLKDQVLERMLPRGALETR